MFIDVFGTYRNVVFEDIKDKNVVVIDVYRATSVIVTALAHGAESVIPVESIEEAWKIFNSDKHKITVLGGEREALPIDGFHLDNSPVSYAEDRVGGKRVVLTTSNGTRAVKTCASGKHLLIASFLNVSCVVKELIKDGNDVSVVCAGTFGRFALEDGLCAGMIVSSISKKLDVSVSELGIAMKLLYEKENNILDALRNSSVACRYLERTGYKYDIDLCLQTDLFDVVPFYKEGAIKA
ncbi:MAG: 2-phosphosulfolactate phosphatase [Spirochaetota bacterium]|nr:MAG: 2-phosphosulfolactate phosphatase [Spirochaetota bacterium]